MTTVLSVVLEELLRARQGGTARAARGLVRALVEVAPEGCEVEGVVGAVSHDETTALEVEVPGLARVHRLALPARELEGAWRRGLPGGRVDGLVHAPSLIAPYRRHDRAADLSQLSVTVRDALPWTLPGFLPAPETSRIKALARRAVKHADAVVVPTHAVAEQLSEHLALGDRLRVIPEAPSPTLAVPDDADERAASLGLPGTYVLASASTAPHRGLAHLLAALARPELADLTLVVTGGDDEDAVRLAEAAFEVGLAERRLVVAPPLSEPDLATVIARARVAVVPSLAAGSGLALLEAFALDTPVVHSDDPALVEVADGAGLVVAREPRDGYAERLAAAVGKAVSDDELAATLSLTGADRSRAFGWRDSAARLWQLHADL